MSEGILYEPRSLWSMRYIRQILPDGITVPPEDLQNGGRYPITITRVALSVVSSLFKEFVQPTLLEPRQGFPLSTNIGLLLRISVPFRQHYMRFPICAGGSAPFGEPSMRDTVTPYASSLWGVNVLNFDRPLFLPAEGTIALDLGGLTLPTSLPGTDADILSEVRFSVNFVEQGGLVAGSSRFAPSRTLTRVVNASTDISEFNDPDDLPPALPPPPIDDPGATTLLLNLLPRATFIPENRSDAREFAQQRSARAGSSRFLSVGAAIDQINYDDEVQNTTVPNVPGTPIAPVGFRIPTRMRTVDGGSGEDWWRPGAPLALVFDSITQALVYPLPYPITLYPGDRLHAEINFSASMPQLALGAPAIVGIAFNGYAAIEG